jgi:hypothetical protein
MIIERHLEPGQSTWKQSNAISNKAWRAIHKLLWSTRLVASCTDNGIWYSDDGGEHWTQSDVTTGTIVTFSSTAYSAGGPTVLRVFAGYSGGILYSDDDGETWTQSSITDNCNSIITWHSSAQRVVASTPGSVGNIIYSNDNGSTWAPATLAGDTIPAIKLLATKNNEGTILAIPQQNSSSTARILHGNGMSFNKGSMPSQTLGNYPSDIIYHKPSGCYIVTGGQGTMDGLLCVTTTGIVERSVSSSLKTSFTAIWNMPDINSNTFIAVKSNNSIYKITKADSGSTYTYELFGQQVPAYPYAGIAITVNNNTRFVVCTNAGIYYADPEDVIKETSFVDRAGIQELVTQAKAYIDNL